MLAVVKPRRINLAFKSSTPKRIIHEINNRYAEYVVHDETDDDFVEWNKTTLAQELNKEMTPGIQLRLLREAHDLTQTALGEKAEVSSRRISDFENGRREISKDLAKRFAMIFNVTPARFI